MNRWGFGDAMTIEMLREVCRKALVGVAGHVVRDANRHEMMVMLCGDDYLHDYDGSGWERCQDLGLVLAIARSIELGLITEREVIFHGLHGCRRGGGYAAFVRECADKATEDFLWEGVLEDFRRSGGSLPVNV